MLQGLDQALKSFGHHPLWAELKQMQTLRQLWPEVVGEAVASQTYPVSVRRQVLQVATASPAWAQNLALQRHLILQKLNSHLPTPLKDIRFSAAAWQKGSLTTPSHPDAELIRKFYGVQEDSPPPSQPRSKEPPPRDAKTAFERWARLVKQQQQRMLPCPLCHCPTPAAELERWSMCGFCYRQSAQPHP